MGRGRSKKNHFGARRAEAGWRAERLAEQREALGALGVDEDEQASVFGGNAARLVDAVN